MKNLILGAVLTIVAATSGALSASAADISLDPTFKTGLHSSGYAPGYDDIFKTGLGSTNVRPDQEGIFSTGLGSHN